MQNSPASPVREGLAFSDLILRGRFALEVRGVSGVNCASHGWSTLCSRPASAGKFILHRRNSSTNADTIQSSTRCMTISSESVLPVISSLGSRRILGLGFCLASELVRVLATQLPCYNTARSCDRLGVLCLRRCASSFRHPLGLGGGSLPGCGDQLA